MTPRVTLPALALALTPSGAALAAEPDPPPARPWTEAFEPAAFVDAYALFAWSSPRPRERGLGVSPQGSEDRVVPTSVRAYDVTQGFALAFAGLDLAHAAEPVGGALSLRFGPAQRAAAGGDAGTPLEVVKQAFASYRAGTRLRLDFGKFDTPYGAEVAESWRNANYSRGLVYWLAQPLFHTGLSALWTPSDAVALRLLAVNGWNQSVDVNAGKSVGVVFGWQPVSDLSFSVGWLGGPEQHDTLTTTCAAGTRYSDVSGRCEPDPSSAGGEVQVDRGGANRPAAFRHLVDLVVGWHPSARFSLTLNGDYVQEGVRSQPVGALTPEVDGQSLLAGALTARWRWSAAWALGARAEYVRDADGWATGVAGVELGSGTLTLEHRPAEPLVLRLEHRSDHALRAEQGARIFREGLRGRSESLHTATLGVVVTTD